MAVHGFSEPRAGNPETVLLTGSFAPAGTGAVTDVKGRGFTVARTGVGEFTITLRQKYNHLLAAVAGVQLASAADMAPQFGSYDASAKTLVLRTQAGATPTDIAANANNRVHFTLAFQKTSLPAT